MLNLVALLLIRHAAAAATTCYHMNGDAMGPGEFGLCDPSAEGTTGSQSSCCSIDNRDTCLSTGLCLSSWSYGADGLLWVSGCTDPTWQDPSCANFCVGHTNGQTYATYALLACSNTTWCCGGEWENRKFVGNKTECCKNTITLPTNGVGSVARELGAVSTTSAASSSAVRITTTTAYEYSASSSSGSSVSGTSTTSEITVAIVGGVLGATLLVSLVFTILLVLSNRQLRRKLQTLQASTSGKYKVQPVTNTQGFVLQSLNQSEMLATTPPVSTLISSSRPELEDSSVWPAELSGARRDD